MERWAGRVAVVTGASSGIGAAIAQELVKKGLHVVGLARRIHRLQEACDKLQNLPGQLYPMQCDITKEQDILNAFSWVKEHLGGVDVMVNNAGVAHQSFLADGETSEWRHMLEVNVLGLSICTREAICSMKEREVTDGHIVHINSISGHSLPQSPTMFYMYGASKHAVTALTEGLRRELVNSNSKIRVTSLSPGLVHTEIMEAGHMRTFTSRDIFNGNPCLHPQDIADAVLYILGTPPHVQIHELTIIPTGQKY
ncbi:farnesol dehydrogenase-like [Zootermopsis nevadensis]|uniref:Dehydrogenase/reductase SDR family member 11 n=1 Tax=Zootermopsis nevadensis TaxID=136037 RepID=A0A067QZX5_ZOONE|nr:farnesol dehydrogenase-like [Zootermopsis nevadensis]KDR16000.1 Dehydrogenase/reductase SDR family member 11 [Zootermopsis nevadensis]